MQRRNSRDKGLPQYGLRHCIYQELRTTHRFNQGSWTVAPSFPFCLLPEERTCWMKCTHTLMKRKQGRKPKLKNNQIPPYPENPSQFHHYKFSPWEASVPVAIKWSCGVRTPPSDDLRAQAWLGCQMATRRWDAQERAHKWWNRSQIVERCRKTNLIHFPLWLWPILWRHNDQTTFPQFYFLQFHSVPSSAFPLPLKVFLLSFLDSTKRGAKSSVFTSLFPFHRIPFS